MATAGAVPSRTDSEDSQRALELFERLAADEFEYVRHYFRPDLGEMSPTEFPEMWDQVTALFGEYEDATVVTEPPAGEVVEDVDAQSVVHLAVDLQGGTFGAAVGFDESGLIADFAFGKADGDDLAGRTQTALRAGRFLARKAVLGGLTRLRQYIPGGETGPTTPDARREFGVTTLERIRNGEFERVVETFTPELREQVPVEQLRAGWERFDGDFDGIESVEYDEEAAVTYVTFDAGERVRCSVHFDEYGRVNGFLFAPAETGHASDYESPAYVSEDAFIEREFAVGTDGSLGGTVAVPRRPAPSPAVVVVHGSGASDRDGVRGANRPYRDIAEGMASRGVATLRYDKRPLDDGTLSPEDRVVADAVDAVCRLRDDPAIDGDRVFVLGHSLGGFLAPRIATEAGARGVVAAATAVGDFLDIVPTQIRLLAERDKTDTSVEEARAELDRVRAGEAAPDETVLGYPAAFWATLEEYDPTSRIREPSLPVLACHAGNDWRIPERELEHWRTLADEGAVRLRNFEDCNHIFVEVPDDQDIIEVENVPGHPTEGLITALVEFVEEN
jgi:dienelactone hydrolase